jgi:hypothetical protein
MQADFTKNQTEKERMADMLKKKSSEVEHLQQ